MVAVADLLRDRDFVRDLEAVADLDWVRVRDGEAEAEGSLLTVRDPVGVWV